MIANNNYCFLSKAPLQRARWSGGGWVTNDLASPFFLLLLHQALKQRAPDARLFTYYWGTVLTRWGEKTKVITFHSNHLWALVIHSFRDDDLEFLFLCRTKREMGNSGKEKKKQHTIWPAILH